MTCGCSLSKKKKFVEEPFDYKKGSLSPEQQEKLSKVKAEFLKKLKKEGYCAEGSCPSIPRWEETPQLTDVSTGCPNCTGKSIMNAYTDRTVLDQKMSQFYMTSILHNPKIDTNLMTLKFAY